MNGAEVVGIDLDAHLEPQVVYLIDVPGAGVTDHIPIARLHEQRSLPESLRQRSKSERSKEALTVADHVERLCVLGFQNGR